MDHALPTAMPPERWSRLRELLDRVLDAPDGRAALLAEIRAEDPDLYGDLEYLIAEQDAEADGDPAAADLAGQRVGPYEIVRELGRGGMGTVFLAVRADDDVRVPVALKLLRHSFFEDSPGKTFRRERQMLVRLDHPHIARLLDWGAIPGGLLYLVLEYVEGEPLTESCARRKLGLAARLDLFREVCAAVQHAHQSLVVHRDLKPANILISTDGGVKLLDFGVAAALDRAAPLATTLHHHFTPTYASPEQLRGEPVTVATDVYSLGVVLYELLTGRLPYEGGSARAVFEEQPAAPSQRASRPEIGGRQLAGDLDSIILKALRKEPANRYLSVERMSADIECYQTGRPVSARQGSRLYVVRRFIRRHRLNLTLATIAVGAMVAGTAISVWRWRIAESRYQALRSFARSVISNVDAKSSASVTEMQRRMSDTAVQHLDLLSREHPDDEELQLEIAASYEHLGDAQGEFGNPSGGDHDSALSSYRKAYAIFRSQWNAHPDKQAGLWLIGAATRISALIPDPAAAVDSQSEGILTSFYLISRYPMDPQVLVRTAVLFGARGQRLRKTGDLAAALASFRRAVDLATTAVQLQPNDAISLNALETFTAETGYTMRFEGDYLNALARIRAAYLIAERVVAMSRVTRYRRQAAFKALGVAETLCALKRHPEAAQYAAEALSELQAIAAEDPSNAQARVDLSLAWYIQGDVLFSEGNLAEALGAHVESLRLRREQYVRRPSDSQACGYYAISVTRVANILLTMRRDLPTATGHFNQAIVLGRQLILQAPSDVYTLAELARAYRGVAEVALRQARYRDAEDLLRQSVGIWKDVRKRSPLDATEAERTFARLESAAGHGSRPVGLY
jgi:serine/threonine protein kinase/tetratricopeptide (TPR) repeat protein